MTPVSVFAEAIRDCASSPYAEVAGNERARIFSVARGAEYHELRRDDVLNIREDFAYRRWRLDWVARTYHKSAISLFPGEK